MESINPSNNSNPPDIQTRLLQFKANVDKHIQEFNASRNPRSNALLIAAVILLGGFMTYNVVSQSLTQVASRSTQPAMATPKPTLTITPSPSMVITPTSIYRSE